MGIRQKSSCEAHAFVVGTGTVIVCEGALRATVQKAIALALIATLAACSSPTTVDSSTPVDASDTAVAVDVQADHAAVDVPQDVQADASLCADGATMCPGSETCPNLQSDNNNCGTCGHRCTGGQVCTAGTCGCVAPQMLCGGTCIDTTSDPMHCGGCTTVCMTADPHAAVPTCAASACVYSCAAGYHACGTAPPTCLDSTSVNSCGTMCSPCAAPPANATATCTAGACSFTCNAGYANISGVCIVLGVPQQIAPLTATFSTSLRPTFRWALPPRVSGARVEIFRDRACTMAVTSFQADGSTGAPAAALPADSTLFWRIRGTNAGGVSLGASPVWEFITGHISAAPNATFLPGLTDIDGDGVSDVVVDESGSSHLDYFPGAAMTGLGPAPSPAQVVSTPRQPTSLAVADVDGDGHADVVVMAAVGSCMQAGPFYVYKGRSTGLPASADQTIPLPTNPCGDVFAIGDVNGDGVSDVAASDANRGGFVYVYHGAVGTGLPATPTTTLTSPPNGAQFGDSIGSGDINGDGFSDLVVGDPRGAAYVYLGGPAGVSSSPTQTLNSPDAGCGLGSNCSFGGGVLGIGDVNRDGYADIAVGEFATPGYPNSSGRVFVYTGSNNATTPLALGATLDPPGYSGSGLWYFGLGTGMAAADLNGDGFGDFVVAAEGNNHAYVYLGASGGVASAPSIIWIGPDMGSFGVSARAVGDVDGDGLGDIGIGANTATSTGRAYVYRGGIPPSALAASTLVGPAGSSQFGSHLAILDVYPLTARRARTWTPPAAFRQTRRTGS